MERIAWSADETFPTVTALGGVEPLGVVVRDDLDRFVAFGTGGAAISSEDGGNTWTGGTVGSATWRGGATVNGRSVLVGSGGSIRVKDPSGDSSLSCATEPSAHPFGGTGTRNATAWDTPCVRPSFTGTLWDVARFQLSNFVVVGDNSTAWLNVNPSGATINRDPMWDDKVALERWVSISPTITGSPNLYDVAPVGDGVVAVGANGTVRVLRAGQTSWEQISGLSLGSVTLRAVAADVVWQWVERPAFGDGVANRRAAIAVVGDDGANARFVINLDDFPPALIGTVESVATTTAWTTADLRGISIDDRTRVVVGLNNNVWVQSHDEDWSDDSTWRQKDPGNGDDDFYAVATDGRRYVAVGQRTEGENDPFAVVWAGTEDVVDCRVGIALQEPGSWTTDTIVAVLDSSTAPADPEECGVTNWANVTVGKVWPVYAAADGAQDQMLPDTEPVLDISAKTLTFDALTVSGSRFVNVQDAEPQGWRVNLFETVGGDVVQTRLLMVNQILMPGVADLRAARRVGALSPTDGSNEFDLADLPYPTAGFVDLMFGLKVNSTSDGYVTERNIVGDATSDACDNVQPLGGYLAPADCVGNPTTCTFDQEARDVTGGFDLSELLQSFTRFRSGTGHAYVDQYEAYGEGFRWRQHSQKHYVHGRCQHMEGMNGAVHCGFPGELSCPDVGTVVDEDWEQNCCVMVGATPASDGFRSFPLFAPFPGQAYRVFAPREVTDSYSKYIEASHNFWCRSPVIDDEAVPPQEPEAGTHYPNDFDVLLINDDRNLAILLSHVDSCLVADMNVAVTVEAGDRIAAWSPQTNWDIITLIRDDDDQWRKISYFELAPTPIYNLYRQYLDFGALNTDGGLLDVSDVDDPVISLEDRDRCPVGADLAEVPTSTFPTLTCLFSDDIRPKGLVTWAGTSTGDLCEDPDAFGAALPNSVFVQ